MDAAGVILTQAHHLYARNSTSSSTAPDKASRPPVYKAVGLCLAIASGIFIGTSFVLKKTGLLKANAKYNEEAGEGYGYLKNAYWWTGMTLMIIGEICNFVAYAFVDAILVTPLGALSVVITTVLSAIFLKERLSFVGKAGCFNCIIGSIVIVMNAPEQSSVADIQEMKHFVIAPGFLSYAGVIIVICVFIALWAGPRYGKKSMLVYLSICSLIGGLSVVATQGLGSAIVAQAGGKAQFNQWFLYVLLVFVVATLLTEIIYLNKALNLFNAALVTPTYYVFFTSSTIVTSAVLFRGFKGTGIGIATVIMGFLQICAGVVLLQLSKSAKDVPDTAVFKGDLDQVRTVAEQEQPESEPKADAIRGGASILRRISLSRQKMEQEEARRLREEKLRDQMEPIGENEIVEWDGLRRRKTVIGESPIVPIQRRKTLHPPLGMSHFPDEREDEGPGPGDEGEHPGFFENMRYRAQSVLSTGTRSTPGPGASQRSPMHPVPLTEISVTGAKDVDTPIQPYGPGSLEEAREHIYGLPQGLRHDESGRDRGYSGASSLAPEPPPHMTNRRQFSFQNVFHRSRSDDAGSPGPGAANPTRSSPNLPAPLRMGLGSRQGSKEHASVVKNATEEERLGLVKGDSHAMFHDAERQHSQSPPQSTSLHTHHKLPSYSSSEGGDEYHDDFEGDEVDAGDYFGSGSDDWQMENKTKTTPPMPPSTNIPPRQRPQPSSINPIVTTQNPLPPLPLGATKSGPGLPPHPAVNIHHTSPDREFSPGNSNNPRRISPDHVNENYEEYDTSGRRGHQQQGRLPSPPRYEQQYTQQRNPTSPEARRIETGPNKLRKTRKKGSEGNMSSPEERDLTKDTTWDPRGGRGGGGAFI